MNRQNIPIALLIVSALLLSCNYVQSFFIPPTSTPLPPTATATLTPTIVPSPTSALPAVCTQFDLTPEECANAGTHKYSTSTEVLFDATGQTCQVEDRDLRISITFRDHETFTYTDEVFDGELELSRKADNLFEGTYTQPDGNFRWEHKITFTETGFSMESASYQIQADQHLCTFLAEETIIPDEDQPTPTPVSAATPSASGSGQAATKQEIVDFMVGYIVKNEIEAMIDIIDKEDVPGLEEAPATFLIVLSPVSQPAGKDDSALMGSLDTANAEEVWIYEKGELTTATDKQAAIQDYRAFIDQAPTFPGIFTWGYNEFGIRSISDDGQEAEVYLESTCGSSCGHGIVFSLVKNAQGQWEIKDQTGIWGS